MIVGLKDRLIVCKISANVSSFKPVTFSQSMNTAARSVGNLFQLSVGPKNAFIGWPWVKVCWGNQNSHGVKKFVNVYVLEFAWWMQILQSLPAISRIIDYFLVHLTRQAQDLPYSVSASSCSRSIEKDETNPTNFTYPLQRRSNPKQALYQESGVSLAKINISLKI